MILDSSFIIDVMNGLPAAVEKLQQLQKRKDNLFVSTISLFELWSGVAQCNQPEKEKQKIKAVLESQLVLEFTKECAEEASLINGSLCKKGMPIDPEDSMIAGTAKHHEESILTKNVQHFSRIKDLKIETY